MIKVEILELNQMGILECLLFLGDERENGGLKKVGVVY